MQISLLIIYSQNYHLYFNSTHISEYQYITRPKSTMLQNITCQGDSLPFIFLFLGQINHPCLFEA